MKFEFSEMHTRTRLYCRKHSSMSSILRAHVLVYLIRWYWIQLKCIGKTAQRTWKSEPPLHKATQSMLTE